MKIIIKIMRMALIGAFTAATLGILATAGLYVALAPQLPSIETLKDVQLQVPLRVYTRDNLLLAEFGEKRRSPLKFEEAPDMMVKAILAAEDDRFFQHPGVDYQGIIRATLHLLKTGQKGQGGSTITMQVARNFFLTREKTYLRKINEIFLALKIERELSKQEILELYLNKIYLGNRAYGVGAAAQVYYDKKIQELRPDQFAMIAGLPKAPSKYNPIANLTRATQRRDYVLGRMRDLGYLSNEIYEIAINTQDDAKVHRLRLGLEAPYVAEMVRADMVARFGNQAYTMGYKVYTSIDSRLQQAASSALVTNLLNYDRRHGYRGVTQRLDDERLLDVAVVSEMLGDIRTINDLQAAVVMNVLPQSAEVLLANGELIQLEWDALKWARPALAKGRVGPAPTQASQILSRGDVIRIKRNNESKWLLSQLPEVAGGLVSLDPEDGAIVALAGGFDFYSSKFNRVTQAARQPGSNFKPFVYSAALNSGYTPASLINDAPVVFDDPGLESTWRPENYSGKFFGPTRLRVALTKSRNLVSIRLLRQVGIKRAISYIKNFGFDTSKLQADLSLALGSSNYTPLEVVTGYAVLANGGYQVEPYFIDRIESSNGETLFEANPLTVCRECEEDTPALVEATNDSQIPEVGMENYQQAISEENTAVVLEDRPERIAPRSISPQVHYQMTSILRDVVKRGTGRRALSLGRKDLAGKTGTTNDQRDAWFSGYNASAVTSAWVGFDDNRPLGARETGARAALPMWIAYMAEALKGVRETPLVQPEDMITVRIDPETGLLANETQSNAIFETFRSEYVPKQKALVQADPQSEAVSTPSNETIPEQLF